MIDEGTEFGARAARHLREEIVAWMTTVTPAGAPLPRPVWFLWDGADAVRMHSMPGARIRNLAANPRVTLHFGGDGKGGDVVVLSGVAELGDDEGSALTPAYVEKYDAHIARIGMTPATFAERYRVPVRIRLTRLSGH